MSVDKARAALEAAKKLSVTDQARYADLLAIASVQASIARAEASEREATALEQLAGLLTGRFG